MYKVIWFDDYGAWDVVGEFDNLADAHAFAERYEDKYAADPYADGCLVEDENGNQC